MLCLTHLSWLSEVGRMPVAVGMGMGMPVSTGMHVDVSRMVVTVCGHCGGMLMHIGMSYLVSLSHWYVSRRSGRLRTSSRGFVLGALLGEGLEFCKRDNRRRNWWVWSPGSSRSSRLWPRVKQGGLGHRSSRLRSRVKQGGLGLLFPVLKCLTPLRVGSKCSLG